MTHDKSNSHLSLKVPSKAATLPLPLSGAPIEKDALYQILSLRSLPDRPSEGALPPSFLCKAFMERETPCFQSPLLLSLKVSGKRTSPLGSPVGSLLRAIPVSRAIFQSP